MFDISRTNALSVNALKTYLYDITILEAAINAKYKDIAYLRKQSESLGIPEQFYGEPMTGSDEAEGTGSIVGLVIGIIATLGGLIALLVSWGSLAAIWEHIFGVIIIGTIILFSGAILTGGLMFLIAKIFKAVDYNTFRKMRNKQIEDDNIQRQLEFEEQDNIRIEKELEQKKIIYGDISIYENQIRELQKVRNKLLAMDFVHPDDIKNKPNICGVMYYLLDTGRASNLQEALNLYDTAQFRDEVKVLLNQILVKLDSIIDEQRELKFYVQQANDEQRQIERTLRELNINHQVIQDNQEAIRYNTDVISGNTETMKLIEMYNFLM